MEVKATVKANLNEIPLHRVEMLARHLVHAVDKYFEQPGVQEAYKEWLKEYQKKKGVESNDI